MSVSAIITTYKRDYEGLRRAIESVINQTYQDIEIMVINDTPKEDPLFKEIESKIKEYGDRVNYYAEGINQGACFVRNFGVEKSKGQYIGFLDDDDEWEPLKIEEQVEILEKYQYPMTTVNFVICTIKSNGEIIKKKRKSIKKIISYNDILKKNNVGGASAPLIRRSAFMQAGGFDNSMPAAQDYDLWIRIAELGNIYYIDKVLQKYNIYEGERISNSSRKKIIGYKKLLEKYANANLNNKSFLISKNIVISYHYYKLGDKKNGWKYYKLATKAGIFNLSLFYYSVKIFKELIGR